MYKNIFLKQEKSEKDFERKRTLVLKEKYKFQYFKKILWKMSKFLMDNIAQISQNIFAHSNVSKH